MADSGMNKHNRFCICDYVAAISTICPKKCWAFQSLNDYNNFERLHESTGESFTTLEAERTRNGKEVESKNPAGNADDINNNNLTSDVEELPDDLTLGEVLRNIRAVKVNKNKEKQKALEVEEPRLSVVGSGGDKGKQKALEVDEPSPAGSYDSLGGLKPWNHDGLMCSISKNPAEFNTQIAKRFMRKIWS